MDAQVGPLFGLGRCLLLPDCPIGILYGHLLESIFKVEYIPNDKFIVPDDMALQFKKVKHGTMYSVAAKLRTQSSIMNVTVNERLNMYSKSERAGIEPDIQLQKSL